MCGIAGGTGPDDDDRRSALTAQLGTLRRRGPDSWGFLAGPGATVGQTRLAIIDLTHGDPPLTDESGHIRVALNGEIYNYRELLADLRARGHTPVSSCDTEVIAHLAEELEPVELARTLEGMFAFAVWDADRRRLVLGRDRLGKKPLYYWHDGADLVFGSEIKAVLADPRVPRRLDASAIPAYLAYGYAPSPGTFYEGIRSLPPGSVLVKDESGVRVLPYWSAPVPATDGLLTGSFSDLARELRSILQAAVTERMIADVPLGAFLSGGLDSSAVVALMCGASSGPVRTFCIGFDEYAYDERRWARAVARHLGTDHCEDVARPAAATLLDEVLAATDQPFADSSAIPTFLLAQMTRRDVTVALSGDGGDECFAGYDRFAAALALGRLSALPAPAGQALRTLGQAVGGAQHRGRRARAGRFLEQVGRPWPAVYLNLVRLCDDRQLAALVPAGADAASGLYADLWWETRGAAPLSRLLDLNRRTYLLDDLLVKVDRTSMAHGLEVRSPLLDRRVVEFAAQAPPAYHLRGRRSKRLLKAAVADLLPPAVLDRPKRGFGVPLDEWFRGPLRAEAEHRLGSKESSLRGHLDTEATEGLLREHLAGQAAHGQRLWALLMLERFLDREHF